MFKKDNKSSALVDFWNLECMDPLGIVHLKDGSSSIVFQIRGVDPYFYSSSEWEHLFAGWRRLLKLNPGEEVQILFSKSADFETLVDKRFQELDLVKNPFSKTMMLKSINMLLADVDPADPRYFRSSLYWVYSKSFKKEDSIELRTRTMKQKIAEWDQLLNEVNLQASSLNEEQIMRAVMKAAHLNSYIDLPEGVKDWPAVEIFPSEIKVNDTSFRSLSMQTLPERFSQMGMILAITSIPASFTLSMRFKGENVQDLYDKLDRKRRVLFGILSRKKAGDLTADARYQELNDLLQRINTSSDALLSFGLSIGVPGRSGNDYLQRWTINEIINAQAKLGFAEFREPYLTAFDSYLETLPTFKGERMAIHTILSSNGVHFLPLYQGDYGDDRPVATYRTLDGGIFSIHPSSPKLANFNWLVSGTSGSGKSFFVNSLLLQTQSLNPRLFVIDVGGSYSKLTKFLDGRLVGFDARSEFTLSPFFLPKAKDSVEESKRREHIQFVFWEMLRDEERTPTIEEKALLKEVLVPYFEADLLPKRPITQIRNQLKERGAERLALLLDRWCFPSFYGNFLDSNTVLSYESPIMTFDLKGLNDFADLSRVVQLILCSGLWAVIRQNPTRFTFVVLDEVAFTLLKAQPHFVDELVSTVRKYNTGVIVITQDLEKITSNPAGASILQNTQMKAILQQRGDPKNYAEPLQLNPADLEAIHRLGRKKGSYSDVFLIVDDKKAVIRYAPNAFEYLLSTTVPQENAALENKISKMEGSFAERFLKIAKEMKP